MFTGEPRQSLGFVSTGILRLYSGSVCDGLCIVDIHTGGRLTTPLHSYTWASAAYFRWWMTRGHLWYKCSRLNQRRMLKCTRVLNGQCMLHVHRVFNIRHTHCSPVLHTRRHKSNTYINEQAHTQCRQCLIYILCSMLSLHSTQYSLLKTHSVCKCMFSYRRSMEPMSSGTIKLPERASK